MERERAVLNHRDVVQPFLKDAFKEGAHRIKPKGPRPTQNEWFRQIMIGVVYNDIGSTATLEELAHEYGTFKQSIAATNKSFLTNLWNNSSSEIREEYPLIKILRARKPWSQESRERKSLGQGGLSVEIAKEVEKGVTDPGEISEITGIPKKKIQTAARTTLEVWKMNIPRRHASYRKDLEQLEKETDDKKTQELLDGIPLYVVRGNLEKKGESSLFSSLAPLIREAGFSSRSNRPFATSLDAAGVPITIKDRVVKGAKPLTLTYYFLLSRDKDRAIKALKEDPSLQGFRR